MQEDHQDRTDKTKRKTDNLWIQEAYGSPDNFQGLRFTAI